MWGGSVLNIETPAITEKTATAMNGTANGSEVAAARAVGAVAFAGAERPAVMSFPVSRERISAIAHGPDTHGVQFPVTRERLLGYRQAVEDVGIAWQDVLVAVCARNDADEAQRAATTLLSSPDRPGSPRARPRDAC